MSTFQKFRAGTGTVNKMKRTLCFLGQQEMKSLAGKEGI